MTDSFKSNETLPINDFINYLKGFDYEVDNSIRDKILKDLFENCEKLTLEELQNKLNEEKRNTSFKKEELE